MTDTIVKCDHCGAELNMRFAAGLRTGWPTCCKGHTMRLVSHPDVEKATMEAFQGDAQAASWARKALMPNG